METNQAHNPSQTCRNCQASMPEGAKYCPACSQKYTTGRISIKDFLADFFHDFLNIDAKLPKTMLALFIPGKLTTEYFKGRHKSFASPLRLFLITGVILFAYLSIQMKNVDIEDDDVFNLHEHVNWLKFQDHLNAAKIKTDSIYPANVETTDSLIAYVIDKVGIIEDSIDINDNGSFEGIELPKLAKRDLLNDSQDELIKKYGKDWGFWKTIFFKQTLKLGQGFRGVLEYFIGHSSITIFFMMPFLALLLKILYIRRDYFYVEHLIFAFHYHAFLFLIVFLLSLLGGYLPAVILGFSIAGIFVYLYIAMLKVYQQGWFKTLIKFFTLLFGYIVIMLFISALSFMISFLMF